MSKWREGALAVVLGAWFVGPTQGADSYWTNAAGGTFSDAANWDGGVPGAADTAHFTNVAIYQVDWVADATNANAIFDAHGGTVTQAITSSFWWLTNSYVVGQASGRTATVVQTSGTLLVTNAGGTPQITIGDSGVGTFVLQGGTVIAGSTILGNVVGSRGALTLEGGVWSNSANLFLGNAINSGGHNLLLTNGAKLFSSVGTVGNDTSSHNNRATITGAGSRWDNTGLLKVGYRGTNNQLHVLNGGVVASGSGIVGDNSGSEQSAWVAGSGSLWTNSGDLTIGNTLGSGSALHISDSGKVYSANGTIGFASTTSNNLVVVDGNGSVWINSVTNFVGDAGSFNRLLITNGGLVQAAGAVIGNRGGASNNLVVVTDSGSVWSNTGPLTVGNFSGGGVGRDNQLVITNGGKVYSGGGTLGAGLGANNNAVLVDGAGSEWNNTGNLLVGKGTGNSLTIISGGLVANAGATIGGDTGADANSVMVSGPGSVWSNTGAVVVGQRGAGNQLIVTNGGVVYSASGILGNDGLARNSLAVVTGDGSVWTNTGTLTVGFAGGGHQLAISESGKVYSAAGTIGSAGITNLVTVSGAGSSWNIVSNLLLGNSGFGNQLIVSDGGTVNNVTGFVGGVSGGFAAASNQSVLVTGSGSVWSNSASLIIGASSSSNSLAVRSGGKVYNTDAFIGSAANLNNNAALVTDSGSVWTVSGNLNVGRTAGSGSASGNSLIISNGGMVATTSATVGSNTGANNNRAVVTDAGSIWTNAGTLLVGFRGFSNSLLITNGGVVYASAAALGSGTVVDRDNTVTITGEGSQFILTGAGVTVGTAAKGTNRVLVTEGGLLEANTLIASAAAQNIISNVGGIYQFTTNAPTITTNSASPITLADGTISFRGITNASVYANVLGSGNRLTNISYSGNNTFRLNSSSNASGVAAYTFRTGLGATNYVALELVNGDTLWRSGTLTIGADGSLLASNTVGRVEATTTNLGSIRVVDSKLTFANKLTVSGRYVSDPSTNTFLDDVTVAAGGGLAGGAGDLFDFRESFLIHNDSNPTGVFDLASSTVSFSGGGIHTNEITGQDYGNNGALGYPDGFTVQNFSYGRLTLDSTNDVLCLGCGNLPTVASNALYVSWLDLTALTNQASVSWLVTNLFHAPTNINLYYLSTEAGNSYLGGLTYQLTDCNGDLGGFLMPAVPEPSTLFLLTGAGLLLLRRRN